MIGNVASTAEGRHKIHSRTGLAYGKVGKLFFCLNVLQVRLCNKGRRIILRRQLHGCLDIAGLQADIGLQIIGFQQLIHGLPGSLSRNLQNKEFVSHEV